jgi:hypothetical protein
MGKDDTDMSVVLYIGCMHVVILDWYFPEISVMELHYYWKYNRHTGEYDFKPAGSLLNNPISSASGYDAIKF